MYILINKKSSKVDEKTGKKTRKVDQWKISKTW